MQEVKNEVYLDFPRECEIEIHFYKFNELEKYIHFKYPIKNYEID